MEFLEVPLFDDDLFKLIVRFCFNLVFLALIVGVSYNSNGKNRNYKFMFLLMNVIVFFICFTLKKLDLGLGMALGLFAIFAIIRYRTETIKVKEMTYLFVVIGIAVINSLSNKQTSYAELLFTNVTIFAATYFLERLFVFSKLPTQSMVYDNLEYLKPEKSVELYKDLKLRTGLDVNRVSINKIDLKSETATIVVHYQDPDN